MGMFTGSNVGRRAGLLLLGIPALLVARGWHRTRAVSTDATADDRGACTIDDPVAGTYQIAALADRHLPMRSEALVLGPGEHRDGVDLVLPPGGVGDVITSIDGVDAGVLASETVCALFEPPPGTVQQLVVARGATVTVVAAPR